MYESSMCPLYALVSQGKLNLLQFPTPPSVFTAFAMHVKKFKVNYCHLSVLQVDNLAAVSLLPGYPDLFSFFSGP